MKELLDLVERPSQYLGNEINAVQKDPARVELRVGLAYPDLYEIGMSNTGLHILYYMLNERPEVAAERVYLPGADLEALLRERGVPLATLESGTPLRELDLLGIQIPHELAYANIVKTIRLGGISTWARERADDEPLILAGGPGAFGAEPVAPFYDAMLLGDAEEALFQVLEVVRAWRRERWERPRLWRALAQVTGVYVPPLYEASYHADGRVAAVTPLPDSGAPPLVHKAVIKDLETAFYPDKAIVPWAETVHNRLGVEVMRGCTVGCRFCQAGMIYRPVRERSPRRILDLAKCGLGATGFEDISLLSLDTGDYTLIDPLTKQLLDETAGKRVALSLPSLRAGSLTDDVIRDMQRVRRTSFTIAPEAGTQRLRDVINKNISDQEIFETVERVARNGWEGIKLYFMIGFPTETDADLDGLVDLVVRCRDLGRRLAGHRFEVTASVGTLVPKPQTPFQWDPQLSMEESRRRLKYLEREFKVRRISYKYHQPLHSWMEGVFSRGDRRLAPVIAEAEAAGAGFESWGDRLKPDLWRETLARHGFDPEWFLRRRTYEEVLPWDHLSARVTKKFLLGERLKVDRMAPTPGKPEQDPTTFDCRDDLCAGCSCCFSDDVRNRLAKYDQDPFKDGRPLPMALTSRIAALHGVAQQALKKEQVRDQAARAGEQAALAKLRRERRPEKPSARRWAVTPGAPGLPGPAPAFLDPAAPGDGVSGDGPPPPAPAEEAAYGQPLPSPAAPAPQADPPPAVHYRVIYTRRGTLRFLSHKETMRTFYRLLVRADLPIRYTAGYHPKAKLAFGPPLPVGCESQEEELDLWLTEPRDPAAILAELRRLAPVADGLEPVSVTPGDGHSAHGQRRGARWQVDLASLGRDAAAGAAAVAAWEAADSLPLAVIRPEKKPRTVDLKQLLHDLVCDPAAGTLSFDLFQDGPSAKPSEVAAALLGLDPLVARAGRYLLLRALRREPGSVVGAPARSSSPEDL